jgi:hypothetical protein
LIDIIGCATIEAVLLMSAWQIMSSRQIAGLKQQVKLADRDIAYPLRSRDASRCVNASRCLFSLLVDRRKQAGGCQASAGSSPSDILNR